MPKKSLPSVKAIRPLIPQGIALINETAMLRLAEDAIALDLIKSASKPDESGKVHIKFDDQITRVFDSCCAHHFLMGLLFYWHHNQSTQEGSTTK